MLPIEVDATVDYDAARMLLDLPEKMSPNPDPWEKEGINEDAVCKATGVMKEVEFNTLPQDHGGQNHKGDYCDNWALEGGNGDVYAEDDPNSNAGKVRRWKITGGDTEDPPLRELLDDKKKQCQIQCS